MAALAPLLAALALAPGCSGHRDARGGALAPEQPAALTSAARGWRQDVDWPAELEEAAKAEGGKFNFTVELFLRTRRDALTWADDRTNKDIYWWAYYYRNPYMLAAIRAYGGEVDSQLREKSLPLEAFAWLFDAERYRDEIDTVYLSNRHHDSLRLNGRSVPEWLAETDKRSGYFADALAAAEAPDAGKGPTRRLPRPPPSRLRPPSSSRTPRSHPRSHIGPRQREQNRTASPIQLRWREAKARLVGDSGRYVEGFRRRKAQWEQEKAQRQHNAIVLLGKTGMGKSTLCRVLLQLQDSAACSSGTSAQSVTREVEHASGPWFGDTSLGNLTVVDTPGFHDTAGESMDAMNWAKTVAAIRRLRAVDAIVLVVERTFRADTFAEQAIRQLRASFGIEIWRHLVLFVKGQHFASPEELRSFEEEKGNRRDANARTEFGYEAWRGAAAAARAEMLAVIESVPVFGADLASGLDSPAAPSRPNRAVESGLATLPELRSYLWTKRSVGHVFDVQRAEPRFGPSRPDAEQRFECLWPQECVLRITGKELSSDDQVRLFDGRCGKAEDSVGEETWFPAQSWKVVEGRGGSDVRFFDLGRVKMRPEAVAGKVLRVCYCEFGVCSTPGRFSHEVGSLTIRPATCKLPACTAGRHLSGVSHGEASVACDDLEALGLPWARSEVTFTCEEGYAFSQTATSISTARSVTCSDDGADIVAPACAIVHCLGAAPQISQATSSGLTGAPKYGDVLPYTCAQGYAVGAASKTGVGARCSAAGRWELRDLPEGVVQSLLRHGCSRWAPSAQWGACEGSCGPGFRYAAAVCEPAGAACDPGLAPDVRRHPAHREACVDHDECPDCGSVPRLPHSTFVRRRPSRPPSARVSRPRARAAAVAAASLLAVGEEPERAQLPVTAQQPQDPVRFWELVEYRCEDGYTIDGREHSTSAFSSFELSCDVSRAEGELRANLSGHKVALSSVKSLRLQELGCRRWEVTPWSNCSCAGYRTREVVCSTGSDVDCGGRGSIPQQLNLVNLREGCVPPDDCREVAERGHETTSAWYKRFNKWLVGVLGVVIAALLEAFRACGSRLM